MEDYFSPDAVDSSFQEVARFLQLKRRAPATDAYFVEFDALRRKAESKIQMGGGIPEGSVSILQMKNAALSRQEKSLVLASVQGGLGSLDVAKQMRRLIGSCC